MNVSLSASYWTFTHFINDILPSVQSIRLAFGQEHTLCQGGR